jgi:hypothetical protein
MSNNRPILLLRCFAYAKIIKQVFLCFVVVKLVNNMTSLVLDYSLAVLPTVEVTRQVVPAADFPALLVVQFVAH